MISLPDLYSKVDVPSLELPWEQDIIALRRDFHTHPELGFEEIRTSGIVAERLRQLGLEVQEGVGKTGVIGLLKGGKPGPCIIVRADMDALPILEENNWDWKSETPGKMHACGHDAHTAIGLTVARLLSEERENLAGTIKFMFQPAEEGQGGADSMIQDGLLENPKADYCLALHVWSPIPVGEVHIASGPVMACADRFSARIIGVGGHGAMPEQTVDPILVGAHVITALQSIISRNVKPLEAGVVTVGKFQAGEAFNVIPNEAILQGTLRAFTPEVRKYLENRCREIVETLPAAFGAKGEFEFFEGYPATVNNSEVTHRVRNALEAALGHETISDFEPTMGAEDMSMVLQEVPGCYFYVGGRNPEIDAIYPHHHPKFNIDERALSIGTQAMIAAVKELLS